MDLNKIELLKKYISESNNIVFFGGAGVSTESNIPDFRSSDGIFSKNFNKTVSPEQLVSKSFYLSNPEEFFNFYLDNMIYPDAKPNNAHKSLAELERQGKLTAVVTQNIDGLHQAAGSKKVFELHGTVHSNTCHYCNSYYNLIEFLKFCSPIPRCPNCGNTVKPDVVLYQESLDDATVSGAIDAISKADMLIVGGTSLSVYPASGFIDFFKGKYFVLINKSSTSNDTVADLIINDPIGEVLYEAVFK